MGVRSAPPATYTVQKTVATCFIWMPRRKRSVKNAVHKHATTVKFGRKDFGGQFK